MWNFAVYYTLNAKILFSLQCTETSYNWCLISIILTKRFIRVLILYFLDPFTVLTASAVSGYLGQTVTLPCSVYGNSYNQIFWTFQPMDQTNETTLTFNYYKHTWSNYSPSLQINYLALSDMGYYRCYANSSLGLGHSLPTYVEIKGKF